MSAELDQARREMARSAGKLAGHAVEITKRSVAIHRDAHTPDGGNLAALGHMLDPENEKEAKASVALGLLEHVRHKGEELVGDGVDLLRATGKGVVALTEMAEIKGQELVAATSERARRVASFLQDRINQLN